MSAPLTAADVRAMALALPGVEEAAGQVFRVRGKPLARLEPDGEAVGLRIPIDERDMLIELDPETFYVTDHYRNYPAVFVRIASVAPGTLRRLLVQHWRRIALKAAVKAFDAAERIPRSD